MGIAVGAVAMWCIDAFRPGNRATVSIGSTAAGTPLRQPAAEASSSGDADRAGAGRGSATARVSGAEQGGATVDERDEARVPGEIDSHETAGNALRANALLDVAVSDAHRQMLVDPSTTGSTGGGSAGRHAELEAEPEDDSWSYFMEQSLRQFLGQHPKASLFTIFNVECRTTLCEIQATGYDPSTAPDWDRILYDLGQQPWYDFRHVGTSQDEYQGQLAIVTHLTRRESE